MDSFGSEKLFPSGNLLDLEDLNEGDFLNNVVRTANTILQPCMCIYLFPDIG